MNSIPNIASYENLKVWQSAVALSKSIYRVTEAFPKSEIYGLTNQMRRSAVSVASNIAEGSGRNSSKEFSHFVGIALGSLAELDTQCVIAENMFLDSKLCAELRASIQNLRKMLSGFNFKLKAASH